MNKKMIYRKLFWLITAIILIIPGSLLAEDSILNKEELINKNEPIEINSDRMDAFNAEKLVTFSGNAVATQGDKVLKADELRLYYKKETDGQTNKGKKSFTKGDGMEKIQAKGNVSSTQGERTVTGDEATYYHETGEVIITGNVVMREGNNVIRGCKATIYRNENRGKIEECEPGKNQRVHTIIQQQKINKMDIN